MPTPPALKQMIDVFHEVDGPVLAVERVPREDVSSYGIIDAEEVRPGVYRIRDLVEKPPRAEAPSDLAIIGRYILTPDIFPALEATATRSDRRDSADQRPASAAEGSADLRLPHRRRPPRHGQQAGIPEGGGLLRAAAAGHRRAVRRLPAHHRSRGICERLRRDASPRLSSAQSFVAAASTPVGVLGGSSGVPALAPSRLESFDPRVG